MMDVGRMAVFSDPDGAMFCAWEAREHAGAGRVNDAGCMAWNEIQSGRPDEAAAFYAGLFGWETEPITEGDRTVYLTIKNSAGRMNGGIMPATGTPDAPSFWLIYFTVPSCDAAVVGRRSWAGACSPGRWSQGSAGSRSSATRRAPRSRSSRARRTSRG